MEADVTQLFVECLPDEAFNIQTEEAINNGNSIDKVNTQEVVVSYDEGYQLRLAENIRYLAGNGEIKINGLSRIDGLLVDRNTLCLYYYIKKIGEGKCILNIGRSYSDMEKIGIIRLSSTEDTLEPAGLSIIGGGFVEDKLHYHEPYHLKLITKKAQSQGE